MVSINERCQGERTAGRQRETLKIVQGHIGITDLAQLLIKLNHKRHHQVRWDSGSTNSSEVGSGGRRVTQSPTSQCLVRLRIRVAESIDECDSIHKVLCLRRVNSHLGRFDTCQC